MGLEARYTISQQRKIEKGGGSTVIGIMEIFVELEGGEYKDW